MKVMDKDKKTGLSEKYLIHDFFGMNINNIKQPLFYDLHYSFINKVLCFCRRNFFIIYFLIILVIILGCIILTILIVSCWFSVIRFLIVIAKIGKCNSFIDGISWSDYSKCTLFWFIIIVRKKRKKQCCLINIIRFYS